MNDLLLADIAVRISAAHAAAMRSAKTAIEHAREAGALLMKAKAAVPHGGWLEWLSENVSVGSRQAQRYMRLANTTCGTHLSISAALDALADKRDEVSGPDEASAWLPVEGHVATARTSRHIYIVQESAQHPGYFDMVRFFDILLEDQDGGIDFMRRPILGQAADLVLSSWGDPPQGLLWTYGDDAGYLRREYGWIWRDAA